jgi:hypothetical protein
MLKTVDRVLAPLFAAEVTPIENWLELEAGATALFTPHSRNGIPTFYPFQRPWTLSKNVEFMSALVPGGLRANPAYSGFPQLTVQARAN